MPGNDPDSITSNTVPSNRNCSAWKSRINDLLALVHQLAEENRALRNRQDTLATERATLLQKNEQVRTRVEAMIGRLRTMETGA